MRLTDYPRIALLIVALLWSSGGVLIKMLDWPGPTIACLRGLIVFIVFAPLMRGHFKLQSGLEGLVAFLYAGALFTFVVATKLTSAANAIVLQYSAPVFVAIFSWYFLKERISKRDSGFIALIIGGMVLFFLDQLSSDGMLGNLIAILSGASFGAMVIAIRNLDQRASLRGVWYGNFILALGLIFVPLPEFVDIQSASQMMALSLFQIALPYYLYTKVAQRVSPLDAVLILTLEPILNPIWVMLTLGEKPGPWAILGAAVVILGIALRQIQNEKTSMNVARIGDPV
jgi:drug/metabolite transporter (DMT)-like permease